jgi:bifunctional UDP-N-acetylglucosamine pyrophosphorylase/glucosamine-1-phosphate N-acetyltransferase
MQHAPAAIILAAGKGTRMNSDLPKVAHEAAGSPLVLWVARACRDAGCSRIVVVVGHQQEVVRAIFERAAGEFEDVEILFAVQDQQHGTGHAAQCALPALGAFEGDVFVLVGDGPLIRAQTLSDLHRRHVEKGASATMATAELDDPMGYGRIVRDANGRFISVVEHKEATPEQRAIREINPSIYCFRAPALADALSRVKRSEASGEYYITDVPSLLLAQGEVVEVVRAATPEDAMSVNTPAQLAEVDSALRGRLGAATGKGGA